MSEDEQIANIRKHIRELDRFPPMTREENRARMLDSLAVEIYYAARMEPERPDIIEALKRVRQLLG